MNFLTWAIRYSGILFLAGALALSPLLAQAQNAPRAAVPPPQVPGKELVAVLDLEAVGASRVEASAMTDRLREELLKTGRFTIVDRAQMQAVLDEQALQQTGCTSQECAVQVGKVLGVKKIIAGKVTKISDTQWLLSAQIVDVETAETQRAESLRYRGDYFSMMDEGIVSLVNKLAAPVAAKPDMAAQLAAQQQAEQARATKAGAPAPAPPKPEEKKEEESKGISMWWWIAGGVAVAAVAVAASSGGSKSSGSSGGGCATCGKINIGW